MKADVRPALRHRGLLFAALSIVCIVTAAVYVIWVRQRYMLTSRYDHSCRSVRGYLKRCGALQWSSYLVPWHNT